MQKQKEQKKSEDVLDELDDELDDDFDLPKSSGGPKTIKTVRYYKDDEWIGYIGSVTVVTRIPAHGIRRVRIIRSESFPDPMTAMRKAKELANVLY